jgi:HEAT repeat protein
MGPQAAPALALLEAALLDRDDGVQMHAARALGNLKAAPERIVPALLGLLREHSTRRVQGQSDRLQVVVHAALHNYGTAALPALLQTLDEAGDRIRLPILSILGHLGPQAAPAVPVLAGLLADGNPAVRRLTAFVLGQIGPGARETDSGLRMLLRDADATVRVAGARALWRMGAWSEEALQVLRHALIPQTVSTAARIQALQALGQIGPSAAEATPALRRILDDPSTSWAERLNASVALWQVAGDWSGMEVCIPLALESQEPEPRLQLLRALPALGPAARRLNDVVEKLQVDPSPQVRATAEAVAKRIAALG